MSDDSLIVPDINDVDSNKTETGSDKNNISTATLETETSAAPALDPNTSQETITPTNQIKQELPPALQSETNDQANPEDNLISSDFTANDARQELAKESDENIATPMPPDDNNPENKKITTPIFWLVGIFCFLAIAIFVAWLLAK